jgi:polyhydroxybutyrate depolymerase
VHDTLERVLRVGSRERRFLLARPDDGRGPLPVVIEFHGSGHFAAGQMATSGFTAFAQRQPFAVVAPEAAIPIRFRPEWPEGRAWNVPGVPLVSGESPDDAPDDVAFVDELITALIAEGIADEARIYLTGFSGGARMCSYLAGVMPERIAAIATVAGLRLPPPAAIAPPPIVALHGRADDVNPYGGGAGPRWDLGVEETAAAYAERYGWSGPQVDLIGDGIIRHLYRDGAQRQRLVTYTLDGRSHGWFGSRDPQHIAQYGTGEDTVEASALIWDFFRDKQRTRA